MNDESAAAIPRRRDAVATRAAILRSAVVAFTRSGYDGAGVREIAEAAGVTAMLVNRYFGSKEGLFTEAVEVAFARPTLLTDDPASLSHDVATALLRTDTPDVDPANGFLLMLRSLSNPRATEILRDSINRHFEQRLAALLPGARATERAALFLSVIAGVQLMRNAVGSTFLVTGDPAALARLLESVLQQLVDR
ncbi:MAG TPA: TetR family transcriptional regulator [Pseudonocardiaceae bacterium]|jgi:AcrR family transcriptional regulator|nr:TetR family transcriptional regulator [Pseudonocardiaceae bacterium]